MYLVLLIIVIIICALLGLIVLIQNPKGGGLTSNFSSQSQLMGVQKTGDFLEKGTWILAISLMVVSLIINVVVKGGSVQTDSQFDSQVKKSLQAPANTPAAAPFKAPGGVPPLQAPIKKK
ncbi:MAG TPA: preprotein translocase subunit SecG [Mucilaginibacter sp.]